MRGLATQQILEEQYGRPTFLQQVTVTANTAAIKTSAITPGSRLLIQSTAAVSIKVGDSAVTITAPTVNQCLALVAAEKFYCCLGANDTHIALYSVPGATVNIFLMG